MISLEMPVRPCLAFQVPYAEDENALERHLADVRAGEPIALSALSALSEIVDYVESYPDLFHHPRENVIFSVYLARCGGQCDLIDRLHTEHARLVSKTHDIREHIQQWWHESPVPRERLAGIIADYLRLQWNHINLEEGSAFNILDRELTADDWKRIEVSAPSATDPLFGNLLRQRFASLFDPLGLNLVTD